MKKRVIFWAGIVSVFAFAGCARSVYVPISQPKKTQELAPLMLEQPVQKTSGSIKGRVSKLYYDAKPALWRYEITASDTSNGKLAHVAFAHKKKIAKMGDLVYAIMVSGSLEQLYLLNSPANSISMEKPAPEPQKPALKRNKIHRSAIKVPSSESISLD